MKLKYHSIGPSRQRQAPQLADESRYMNVCGACAEAKEDSQGPEEEEQRGSHKHERFCIARTVRVGTITMETVEIK